MTFIECYAYDLQGTVGGAGVSEPSTGPALISRLDEGQNQDQMTVTLGAARAEI